jgi:hypothetical protein
MKTRRGLYWLIGAALLLQAAALAGATRLRVTHVPGAPLYKAPVVGKPIMILPLNTPLDAEVKQGEFWKVTVDQNGVKTTGYVHEFLVEEVAAGEPRPAAGSTESIKTQSQLAAQIELKITENKDLIRQQNEVAGAVDDLRALLPKVFSLEDPQKQKQFACDIYLWIGYGLSKMDDGGGAIREFRNMFEVDFLLAKAATENVADTYASQLIATAEKQYDGTFVGYSLQVDTVPKEAVLKVDGKVVGRSPDVITTPKPRITLEIEKEGYRPEKIVVSLKDGRNVQNVVLQRLGKTVRVGSEPPGAAVLLDGQDSGKLTECDLVGVPFGSHRLTIAKEGYAAWEEEITVSEGSDPFFKTATLMAKAYTPASTWGTPESKTFVLPRALALDKAGSFYVADESSSKVRKYGPDRRRQVVKVGESKSFSALKFVSGIAVDGEGACYTTDVRDGSVTRFDKDGQFVRKWGDVGSKGSLLSRPLGIVADRNNDIYVVDSGNSRIVKYASVGVMKATWGKQGPGPGQFNLPSGVTVNSRNEILVVEAGRVQKFTSDGEFIAAFGRLGSAEGEFKLALGICCDKYDNIYVVDGGNGRILKFWPDGRFIGSFGSPGTGVGQLAGPVAVVVDEKGFVFVLEKDSGRIQEFRPPSK